MKKEFLMNLLRNGEAILINNMRLSDNRLIKWVIRQDNKLLCLVEGERFVTVLQPVTEIIADTVFDGMVQMQHSEQKTNVPLNTYCIEKFTKLCFPPDDDLINHFSYSAIMKASYVLIAHSDMYDMVLCTINANAITSNAAHNIVKNKIYRYITTLFPEDKDNFEKTDWRIECEKLCNNASEYAYCYGCTVTFNLHYTDCLDIID